ncbi:hypothetical protein [Agathobacter rectalis]|uniref:hypothetical protein n=1 Tax=Agathobacter rectalis TaxID=39491 RepID=UPI0027D25AC5|nr:hypothetical protein [Agathobacter rectalis]MCB7108369.1 hypothetical protein [Agathobacter rectalis]MCG4811752.1 hypothetical protein [Agathobacter rectalis]
MEQINFDEILNSINGYDEVTNFPKASFCYQQYIEEDVKNPQLIRTMEVTKLAVELILDRYNNNFVKIRIITKSPTEPEFRILWSNILRHMKALANPDNVDKTPIFMMAIVSNKAVEEAKENYVGNIQAINPFSITSYSTQEDNSKNDIIELVYTIDNVVYELDQEANYNIQAMKEEVLQEEEQAKIEEYNEILNEDLGVDYENKSSDSEE